MIRKIRFFSFIYTIYIVLYASALQAYQITPEDIPHNAIVVQAGAFKDPHGIKKIQTKLNSFATIVIKSTDISRIYVVASKKKISKSAFLKKIKKIIPDAFIKKGVIHRANIPQKHSLDSADLTETLNAQTILRTRKKFF